ncbi:MAG TPA: DUF3696 domain-containing protein [Ignavibacteriaceae bacterium]|nr:DUF3696 domain-containing protein [Ignavibacteriaceae bacterium]
MSSNNISISLKNFKSLREINDLEIKPLTFLFGKNGSGKSSFIQSLLFLSHTIQNANLEIDQYRNERVNTSYYKSKYFEFLSFNEISTKLFEENEVDFEIKLPVGFITYGKEFDDIKIDPKILENENLDSIKKMSAEIIQYFSELTFMYEKELTGTAPDVFTKIETYFIGFNFVEQKNLFELPLDSITLKDANKKYIYKYYFKKTSNKPYEDYNIIEYSFFEDPPKNDFVKNLFSSSLYGSPIFSQNYADSAIEEKFELLMMVLSEVIKTGKYEVYWLGLNEVDKEKLIKGIIYTFLLLYNIIPQRINYLFKNISYVPALRETPKSNYLCEYEQFGKDIYYGLLYDLDDRTKYIDRSTLGLLKKRGVTQTLKEFINKHIKRLGLGEEIILEQISPGNSLYGLYLIEKGQKINFSQTSSGFKQLLPIIYKAYTTIGGYDRFSQDICIIEQPELHLHPSLQANLVNVFLDEQIKNRNFIIETHSEHIIRKVQVLIAKGELDRDRVAVYYFDKDEKTGITSIQEMELEDNGFFKEPWPDGFFDEASDLAYTLLEAQIKRKN